VRLGRVALETLRYTETMTHDERAGAVTQVVAGMWLTGRTLPRGGGSWRLLVTAEGVKATQPWLAH
jgi:hypothetical protein